MRTLAFRFFSAIDKKTSTWLASVKYTLVIQHRRPKGRDEDMRVPIKTVIHPVISKFRSEAMGE